MHYFNFNTQSFDITDEPADGYEPVNADKYDELLQAVNAGAKILADLSVVHRPSQHHIWDGTAWTISDEKQAELRQAAQATAWEAIKHKRYDAGRGGCYVKSVDKWFHTDDASRTQYLALQVLPSLPPNLMWKTMDNSFVLMTKALLTEIAMTALSDEQADFANAEKHRALMLKADDPAAYDYSTGWSAVYGG